jgi:Flp pilus assembly protein TadD
VLESMARERASAVVSNAIGVTEVRLGRAPAGTAAIAAFTRAVAEDPACADCHFNLGYAYALGGAPSSALQALREAVRRAPTDGDAHWVLSAVLMASAKAVEAQRELDLAKLLGAPHADAATLLSDHLPKGLERLRTDLDTPPSPVDAALTGAAQRDQADQAAFNLDHARRLIASGQDRDAIGELRRAIFLSPYEDEPHMLLGTLDMRSGRVVEAVDEFKLALWCRETAAGHVALGSAFLELGKRDLARAEADRALVMQPDSTSARALLARIGGTNPGAVVPFADIHG